MCEIPCADLQLDCPHLDQNSLKIWQRLEDEVKKFGVSANNWVCSMCMHVHVGDLHSDIFSNHFRDSRHALSVRLKGREIWCFLCDSIVQNSLEKGPVKEEILSPKPLQSQSLDDEVEELVSEIQKVQIDKSEIISEKFELSRAHLISKFPSLVNGLVDSHGVLLNVIRRWKDNELKNVIVMSGAGISVSAGIPDFRSPGTGLYSNLEKYDLPYPEAIFEISYFQKNPEPFFTLAKELWPGNFSPTPTHRFIKALADQNRLLRNYTQNIDGLERLTGLKEELIVEAHGTFHTASCIKYNCRKKYDIDMVKRHIDKSRIPRCKNCRGLIKPDIVFFGESLPVRFHEQSEIDFPKCDLLIIMGTSLQVYPFAGLVNTVGSDVPRILINMEPAGNFSSQLSSNSRDIFLQGSTDSITSTLSVLLDLPTI